MSHEKVHFTKRLIIALKLLNGWTDFEYQYVKIRHGHFGIFRSYEKSFCAQKTRFTKREWLNVGTVPTFKKHNVGTVPTSKMHNLGTVPTFKIHNIGTQIFL